MHDEQLKFRLCNTMTDGAMLSGRKEETLPVTFNTNYIVWIKGRKITSNFQH